MIDFVCYYFLYRDGELDPSLPPSWFTSFAIDLLIEGAVNVVETLFSTITAFMDSLSTAENLSLTVTGNLLKRICGCWWADSDSNGADESDVIELPQDITAYSRRKVIITQAGKSRRSPVSFRLPRDKPG